MRTPASLAAALLAVALLALATPALAQGTTDTLRAAGLQRPVEIVRDRSGVNHIYAQNEHDLFFAQGYAAARDRLFQLEIWRRQATGTVAELLGPREVQRDIGTRLFRFRGDMARELAHYHPRGAAIVGAFVDGVNAWVAETERRPELLPMELKLLGTKAGRWTPEVVVSRHQGLLGNIEDELRIGRAVAAVGPERVKRVSWFHPGDPDIALDSAVNGALLSAPILALYEAYRRPVKFQASDVRSKGVEGPSSSRKSDPASGPGGRRSLDSASLRLAALGTSVERWSQGSNNWVVSGRRTESGRAYMANDPHRAQSAPSLRSWVHLVAPGWNVIGGGEPEIPGVSIGHNEHGAWGLTVFETDGEDLYVYRTDPRDPSRYWYRGQWVAMRAERTTIPVKGSAPVTATLRYTRHGPVVYEDTAHHVAYAVRAAWLEPGSAPYLASLRMDQARTWAEFRAACAYSNIPGENMVWADTAGNIGWQAVGIAPVRPDFSGLVPVPGDGRYEWAGYLPMLEKPHAVNPPEGFIATANNDLTPPGYAHMNAIGFDWADPYRWARISEVLGSGRKLSTADMMRLQTDYLSLPARQLVPLLASLAATDARVEAARRTLLAWDGVLAPESVAAGIYEEWMDRLQEQLSRAMIPEAARRYLGAVPTKRLVDWLVAPPGDLAPGVAPTAARDSILVRALAQAVDALTKRFGADTSRWQWGQPAYHHATIEHPMSAALSPALRRTVDVGEMGRGGDGQTVGATGGGDNQTSGASFRIIAEAGNWDAAVGTNTPGQSGDPASPHYRDLYELWARDRYFSVPYSRAAVDAARESRTVLAPR